LGGPVLVGRSLGPPEPLAETTTAATLCQLALPPLTAGVLGAAIATWAIVGGSNDPG